jgi:DnaD/phage-associated family protein
VSYPDAARRTPVPDLFFSRDLPELSDPVALKLLLHLLWRVHRRGRGRPAALRETELLGDPVLRRGITVLGYAPEAVDAALTAALGALARRGVLLVTHAAAPEGPTAWWAMADREGRTALERLAAGAEAPAAEHHLGDAAARPNIYALFETNIGVLTPMVAEELREAEAAFAADWIEDAMRSAAANGVRKWSYVRAILDRWRRDGRDDTAGGREDRHEGHRRDAGRGGQARGGHSIVPHIEY